MVIEELQRMRGKFNKMHLCVIAVLWFLDLVHVLSKNSQYDVIGLLVLTLLLGCAIVVYKTSFEKYRVPYIIYLFLELIGLTYYFINTENVYVMGILVLLILQVVFELLLCFDFMENYTRVIVLLISFLPAVVYILIKLFSVHGGNYSDVFGNVCLVAGLLMFLGFVSDIVASVIHMTQEKLFQQRRLADSTKEANEALQIQQEKINRANELLGLQKLKLEAAYQKMHDMAIRDGLTGIYNRGHLNQIFGDFCNEAMKDGRSLSAALFDIDHFKLVNDTYGHLFGDTVIVSIAKIAENTAERYQGIAARYGGEEFVLVFPGKNIVQIKAIVEEMKQKVSECQLQYNGISVSVHVSVGITAYPETCEEPLDLLNHADWAMYYSKKNGRDRITIDSDEVREMVRLKK